jgi:hypothetical protein
MTSILTRSERALKTRGTLQEMDAGLASVGFEDQDAGSGPVHASPSLGPMTGAIHNITARNLHDVSTSVPDDRQFLRSWRRQLHDCMTQQNARIVRFLLADPTPDVSGAEVVRRCTEVLNKYSRPTWNFASSTRDLSLSTSTELTTESLTGELGMTPAALRDAQRRAIRLYVSAAAGVTAAEARLEEKLRRLETVVGRINDLMFLEPTADMEGLVRPARTYLDSVLARISLEEDYNTLVDQYKRFAVLKDLVSLTSFQQAAAPTCTICMTKEVTQAMAPCGHTFCDDCCRSQMTACYICRAQIRDKIRLFFS